jgi:uncharacterized protein YerC
VSEFDLATWDQWATSGTSGALIPARWAVAVLLSGSYTDFQSKMTNLLADGWEIARVDRCEGKGAGAYCIIARRPPKFEERNG